MGEVVRLRPIITPDSDDTGAKTDPHTHKPTIRTITSGSQNQRGYIPTEDLYPIREQYNPTLSTAIKLLEEGIDLIKESVRMFFDGDWISSDDAMQRFQALLPELFCCRDLGDSFGAIISSIYHAINNMKAPLNESQLRAILDILKRIHTEPFIEYEEAVEEILHLESAGFEVSPPHFKFVADLLNE